MTQNKLIGRLCVSCDHFYFSMGSPGYSELTPGWDAEIHCDKRHWEMSNYGQLSEFRENIAKAETCPDFEIPK